MCVDRLVYKDNYRDFFLGIIGKCTLVFLVMFALPFFVDRFIPDTFVGLVLLTLLSVAWSALVVFVVGLSAEERGFVIKQIKKKI